MSPIADNSWWSLLDRGGRLETLERDESRRLLESTNIGRLAYCTDSGPRILPMNYRLISERLIFRTGMDTEASGYLINRPIAFEVDQVDEFLQTGWSVWSSAMQGSWTRLHCVFSISGSLPQSRPRSPGRKADDHWSFNCL
jgi:hypothetical protein